MHTHIIHINTHTNTDLYIYIYIYIYIYVYTYTCIQIKMKHMVGGDARELEEVKGAAAVEVDLRKGVL